MFVCCGRCVLSGRGLCDELITRPEESYQLWCVVVCDLETSRMRRPWPALDRRATDKKKGKRGFNMKCEINIPKMKTIFTFIKRPFTSCRRVKIFFSVRSDDNH
jgi:hypothetical protein